MSGEEARESAKLPTASSALALTLLLALPAFERLDSQVGGQVKETYALFFSEMTCSSEQSGDVLRNART